MRPFQKPFVVPFAGFTAFVPSVPKLYWNVKSQEQRILALCEELDKLLCYVDYQGGKINEVYDDIQWLRDELQKIIDGKYDEEIAEVISSWVDEHMPDIIAQAIKMVWFGLTLDGYFVAYIPDSWDEIVFDTGAVYGSDEYGRLILLMDVDNASDVLPDYAHDHTEMGILQRDLKDLEIRVNRNEETLYNPLEESEVTNG